MRRPIAQGLGRRLAGAGLAVAGIVLTVTGCSQALPLGPAPAAAPPTRHLASAIVLQLVLSQPPSAAGKCAVGYTRLSAPTANDPEVPDACYRKLGTPATFTSAAVAMSYQPATNQQSAMYGLDVTLPATEAATLTAITTKAFHSRDLMAITVAGTTWATPLTEQPLTSGQFEIGVQSKSQALQLQHKLLPA